MSEEAEAGLPPGLGRPAPRALGAAGSKRLGHLAALAEADLWMPHSVGPKAVGLIRDALAAAGRTFAEPEVT